MNHNLFILSERSLQPGRTAAELLVSNMMPKSLFLLVLLSLILGGAALAEEGTGKASSTVPKLFGRIQELYSSTGAKLPVPLEPMTPIRDASLDGALNAGVSKQQSYPNDYRGSWTGELVIISSNFAKSFWEFDSAEADTQSELLKVGTKGRCTVNFDKGKDQSIKLEPCRILFNAPMAGSDQNRFYALQLGDLSSGWGVTGNELNCQLKKNDIKQSNDNSIEQQIVTLDTDRNPRTKKSRSGYTENVLHFTRVEKNKLYLQAASVSYDNDGKFQNKVILSGTLNRSESYPSTY